MAMTVNRALAVLLMSAALGWTPAAAAPARAQAPGANAAEQSAAQFLASAHSSALLQQKAAETAASGEARPEVKQFAQEMAGFRSAQLQRLAQLAAEAKAPLPEPTFEQQVLIDNLKPLDFLALSRRYAELAVQALEQEAQAYEAAQSQAPPVGPLIAEYLPQLKERLAKARAMLQAVGP